ncbi:MAG: DNA polymerase III subunit gamma/tau [Anaerolineae bacterium]|nr:MAG: DNA polymerase III subunit gamma/tau [Anaerolineae bacterium]
MSQALYRKWRPAQWDEVVGQQHVVQTLRNAVTADRVAHAYLFAGPRGTGKTTLARLLAKAVNCTHADLAARPCDQCDNCVSVNKASFLDLIEIDAASNTSVEDVRDLRDKINFSPNKGRFKVYIIDEVHMLSTAAFNALLKTLEEPPPHAIFVLATTEVHKIPATVLSRCQRHEFRRIPVAEIVKHLEEMAKGEGMKVGADTLALIARQSAGGMRDAISLLDQLSSAGDEITLALAEQVLGTATSQAVLDLVQAVVDEDPAAGLNQIHAALDSGADPRQLARQVVDYLRGVLLVRLGNADQVDTTQEARAQMAKHAQAFDAGELLRIIRAFNAAATESRGAWQPGLPLELALVEVVEGPPPEPAAPQETAAPAPKRAAEAKAPAKNPKAQPAAAEPAKSDLTRAQWRQIIAAVRETSPNTAGLLNSCNASLSNGVLTLGFATDTLRGMLEKGDQVGAIAAAAKKVLDQKVQVESIVSGAGGGALPADVDPASIAGTGVRLLGAEIVDINDLDAAADE